MVVDVLGERIGLGDLECGESFGDLPLGDSLLIGDLTGDLFGDLRGDNRGDLDRDESLGDRDRGE